MLSGYHGKSFYRHADLIAGIITEKGLVQPVCEAKVEEILNIGACKAEQKA